MPGTDAKASNLPVHIAVIMDGNGRWAKKRGMPRHKGHRAGVKSVRKTIEYAAQRGIKYLTLFAFSSENWRRPEDEVSKLMALFVDALQREVDELHRNDVRLEFIGERDRLGKGLVRKIEKAEAHTRGNNGLHLIVAIAYGGRWDITEAVRRVIGKIASGEAAAADIDELSIGSELQLGGLPDPDLLIRTGGEQRISNFLLWNLAYAELYFSDTLWPDFDEQDLDRAIEFYVQRQRRYGHTGEQLGAVEC
ncbi:MAG TPA: isoprenyl transferase [Woeseiaceae bacterium]|nr:isoprenyl transferase [Woeseiaceae bacterium]